MFAHLRIRLHKFGSFCVFDLLVALNFFFCYFILVIYFTFDF